MEAAAAEALTRPSLVYICSGAYAPFCTWRGTYGANVPVPDFAIVWHSSKVRGQLEEVREIS